MSDRRRLAVEARRDPDTRTCAINRIAEQTGVHKEALRTWVRKAEDDEIPTEPLEAEARASAVWRRRTANYGSPRVGVRRVVTVDGSTSFCHSFFREGGVRPPTEVIVAFNRLTQAPLGSNQSAAFCPRTPEVKIAPAPTTPSSTANPAPVHAATPSSKNTSCASTLSHGCGSTKSASSTPSWSGRATTWPAAPSNDSAANSVSAAPCAGNGHGRRSRHRKPTGPVTSSNGTSRPPHQSNCE